MSTGIDLAELKERFNNVNKNILHHPSFDAESRKVASFHASTYMISLGKIIEESGGVIPDDALPALGSVIEFIELVEGLCSDEAAPVE